MRRIGQKLKYIAGKVLGYNVIVETNKEIIKYQKKITSHLEEIEKSQKFRDTTIDSDWFTSKAISPGRGAVDYSFLYTLYRVLDIMHPINILEFGLGQSSKLVYQYTNHFTDVKAITCEHDKEWTSFFEETSKINYDINIQFLELEEVNYKNEKTVTYKDYFETFGREKYDLIVVDGPYGSLHYSRSQVIQLVESSIKDRFCIVIDDYERNGEQETFQEVKSTLDRKGIKYYYEIYEGSKQHVLVCSEDLEFLTLL